MQFILGIKRPWQFVRPIHLHRFAHLVQKADNANACFKIFPSFAYQARPALGWRAYFKYQFGHHIEIAGRQRSLRNSALAVIGYISAANRIGVALGENAAIIAHDPAHSLCPDVGIN